MACGAGNTMRPEFSVRVWRRRGEVVLAVGGELDAATGPALIGAVAELATTVTTPRLLLDLSHVSFVDASGLRALETALARTRFGPGGPVVTVKTAPRVERLRRLVHLRPAPAQSVVTAA